MNEPDYKAMFEMAVYALARIDSAMGMPEDGLNNPDRTITAIELLHAKNRDDDSRVSALESLLAEAGSVLVEYSKHDLSEIRILVDAIEAILPATEENKDE